MPMALQISPGQKSSLGMCDPGEWWWLCPDCLVRPQVLVWGQSGWEAVDRLSLLKGRQSFEGFFEIKRKAITIKPIATLIPNEGEEMQ